MFAVAARVLTLAACLPLLLPAGVCLCDAGLRGCARTQVASGGSAPGVVDCCDDCQEPSEQAPAHSCPSRGDSDPAKCPVASFDRDPWVKPFAAPTAEFPPAAVSVVAAPVEVRPVSTFQTPEPGAWPSTPPFYLAHCALLL